MNGTPAGIEFRRNAVEPMECLRGGWNLIKDKYWLFVGMTALGVIIGSVVPLGILLGPMMCGLYLALFQTRRGNPIEFGLLFKGFDYFGESIVATLLHMIPIVVVIVPAYILFYVGLFAMMSQQQGGEPDPNMLLGFFGFFAVFWLVMIVILVVLSVVFTFAYPLIVDRRLSGIEAVKLSIKAAMANFWRLLGLLMMTGLWVLWESCFVTLALSW